VAALSCTALANGSSEFAMRRLLELGYKSPSSATACPDSQGMVTSSSASTLSLVHCISLASSLPVCELMISSFCDEKSLFLLFVQLFIHMWNTKHVCLCVWNTESVSAATSSLDSRRKSVQ
jgi:hypothetical protein